MIKRHKKVTIPLEVIESFQTNVGDPINSEEDSVSQIWSRVFSKFDKSNIRLIGGNAAEQIRNYFEEYFINGLSDGACVGKDMNSLATRYKYLKRERNRLGALFLHLNPGVGKTYSRFGNRFKVSKQNLQALVDKLSNLPLSNLLFSGKPWLYEVEQHSYLLEITDHYYFFDIIKRYMKNTVLKPVLIGDGSGILSNMLLTSDINISDSIFIDLQHFLIRQYIVNFDERSKIQKFLYAQDFDVSKIDGQGMTIINQDSFPEIPYKDLKSYFELIKYQKVDRVISYNHLDLRGHNNYRELLVEYFGEPIVRFESIIRSGYFIEIFEQQ